MADMAVDDTDTKLDTGNTIEEEAPELTPEELAETFPVGEQIVFLGYDADMQGEPVLQEGEEVKVIGHTPEGGVQVESSDGREETAYPEELQPVSQNQPLKRKQIFAGMLVELQDKNGQVLSFGKVDEISDYNIVVEGKKYKHSKFKIYELQDVAEQAAEQVAEQDDTGNTTNTGGVVPEPDTPQEAQETTKEGREGDTMSANQNTQTPQETPQEQNTAEALAWTKIAAGMKIEIEDENGKVIDSGFVDKKTTATVSLGGKEKYSRKGGFSFFELELNEGEVAPVVGKTKTTSKDTGKDTGKSAKTASKTKPASKTAGKTKATGKTAKKTKDTSKTKSAKLAKPKAKKEKATALTVDNFKESHTLSAVLQNTDELDAAKVLVERIEEAYFNLGGCLAKAYVTKSYARLGYTGNEAFAQYTEGELNIKYRKAMYLIDIYMKINALGIDESRLASIGWSKAKELVRVATEENFDDLLEYADNHSRKDLIDHIRDSYVSSSDQRTSRATKTTFKFEAFEDQANVIKEAIARVKDINGIESDSDAMLAIITEWTMLTQGEGVSIDTAKVAFEAKYGVDITYNLAGNH